MRDRLEQADYIGSRVFRFHRRRVTELLSDSLLCLIVGYEKGPIALERLFAAQQCVHDRSVTGVTKRLELELARTGLALRVAHRCPDVTSLRPLVRQQKRLEKQLRKYQTTANQIAIVSHYAEGIDLRVRMRTKPQRRKLVA